MQISELLLEIRHGPIIDGESSITSGRPGDPRRSRRCSTYKADRSGGRSAGVRRQSPVASRQLVSSRRVPSRPRLALDSYSTSRARDSRQAPDTGMGKERAVFSVVCSIATSTWYALIPLCFLRAHPTGYIAEQAKASQAKPRPRRRQPL